MSPTYRKRLRERRLRVSRAGVAARERNMLERNRGVPTDWPLVRSLLVSVYAAPDGRHVALRAADGKGEVIRCGCERAVRGWLARSIYGLAGNCSMMRRPTRIR
jgi:hypothetical protein